MNDKRRSGYDPRLANVGEQELIDALTACEQGMLRLRALVEPTVTEANVADALLCMAEMLGCPVPGPKGIDLFLLAIKDLPAVLLPTATIAVARTHKYMRMPLPADYLAAVQDHLTMLAATEAYFTNLERLCRNALDLRRTDRARFGD